MGSWGGGGGKFKNLMMYIKIHIFKAVKFHSDIEIQLCGYGEGVNLMMYIKIHIFKVVKFYSDIETHFWGDGEGKG